jgi:hypothetical protein
MVPVVMLRAEHSHKGIARPVAVSTAPEGRTGSAAAWELKPEGSTMR